MVGINGNIRPLGQTSNLRSSKKTKIDSDKAKPKPLAKAIAAHVHKSFTQKEYSKVMYDKPQGDFALNSYLSVMNFSKREQFTQKFGLDMYI